MKLFASLTLALSLAVSGTAQLSNTGSGCGGFSMNATGTGSLGTNVDITCSGGIAGAGSAVFIGAAAVSPLPLDFIGGTGCTLYIDTLNFFSAPTGNLDGTGSASLQIPLANDPATIGVVFSNQFAFLDITQTVNPLGAAFSDMWTVTIQP